MHTPGEWRRGPDGSVVTDQSLGLNVDEGMREYYGGYVVAETVTPGNQGLIIVAPDMWDALTEFVDRCRDHKLTHREADLVAAFKRIERRKLELTAV